MLGGIRTPLQVAEELAADTAFWARAQIGMWLVRPAAGGPAPAIGLVGMHDRPDGLGIALRFAFTPQSRGAGLAREAAGAALRYAHDRINIPRIIAVARESNIGSRTVLGAIGMREHSRFLRANEPMILYESLAPTRTAPAPSPASGPG